MGRENKTEYAILGLLHREPMSGYDMKAFISQSVGYFWQESYGQIYPALRRLLKAGFIARQVESRARGPNRHVYRITAQGRKRLSAWLNADTPTAPLRIEYLLKLFFGTALPPAGHIRHLEALLARQKERMAAFASVEAVLLPSYDQDPEYPYWRASLEYGKQITRARMRWCRQTLAMLRSLAQQTRKQNSKRKSRRKTT